VVVEWDAREMGAAARGRGERERGRERGETTFFVDKPEVRSFSRRGRRNSVDQGRLAKGTIVCILCLQGHDRGLLPFNQALLERRRKEKSEMTVSSKKKKRKRKEKGKKGKRKKKKVKESKKASSIRVSTTRAEGWCHCRPFNQSFLRTREKGKDEERQRQRQNKKSGRKR
jgi:hypothetical protein